MVLGGPSLVEALPPLRCVTLGRELAMGHLFTHLQSRTRQGSSEQFASGSLPATFSSGEAGKTGFKMADAEMGSLRAHTRHPRPGASLKLNLFYLNSHQGPDSQRSAKVMLP